MKVKEAIILLGQCEGEYELTCNGSPVVSITQLKYETTILEPDWKGSPRTKKQASMTVTLQTGSSSVEEEGK